MGNSSGWGLTGRLVSKHFGALGDSIATMIANFDPETATEADRDQLADRLRDAAGKYAAAKTAFGKEQADVDTLRTQIESDTQVAKQLGARLAAGSVDEATVNLFCDELESAKTRLPQEEQEAADAKTFMDELKSIIDSMSDQLAQFDAYAAKVKRELASANAHVEQERMRQEQQEQLRGMQAGSTPGTALQALQKRAQAVQQQAEGMKVVNDVTDRPVQQKAKLDELRKSVLTGSTSAPSAADRLAALSK